jgi:hypothetical protein
MTRNVLFIDAETVREHHRLHQASGVAGLEWRRYEGATALLVLCALRRIPVLR